MALELVTDVEERMEVWVEEIGIWVVFQVMTMIAQVKELVAKAEEVDGSSRGWLPRLDRTPGLEGFQLAPGSRVAAAATPDVDLSQSLAK